MTASARTVPDAAIPSVATSAEHQSPLPWSPPGFVPPPKSDWHDRPARSFVVPGWINSLLSLAMLVSIPLALLFGRDEVMALGFFAMGFGSGAMLGLLAALSRQDDLQRWRFADLAQRTGWRFRMIASRVTDRSPPKGKVTARTRPDRLPVDPLDKALAATVPELMQPHPGYLFPFHPQAAFWGDLGRDLPFLLMLMEIEADMTFAAAALKHDRHGNAADHGVMVQMLLVFPLPRPTGLRAVLRAEMLNRDSLNDVKTESAAFNDRFNVTLTQGHQEDLFRLLSPFVQMTLVDLAQTYDLQCVFDGDLVWCLGRETVLAVDPDTRARLLPEIVAEFGRLSIGFRNHVG